MAGCGQSRHLDRPWMRALPQTGLMVDGESTAEVAPPAPLPSSSSTEKQQQQQQLAAEDDNHGVSGCVKPHDSELVTEPGADLTAAGGGGGCSGEGDVDAEGDEDNVDGKISCPRCDQEFHCKTRYEKHCKKCCDD